MRRSGTIMASRKPCSLVDLTGKLVIKRTLVICSSMNDANAHLRFIFASTYVPLSFYLHFISIWTWIHCEMFNSKLCCFCRGSALIESSSCKSSIAHPYISCFDHLFLTFKQKVENTDKIVGTVDPELKKQTLRYRRCIVLAVVGGTPIEAPSLARLVVNGYLDSVKLWLDEILSMPEGVSFATVVANVFSSATHLINLS
jgi:hypothetical protein